MEVAQQSNEMRKLCLIMLGSVFLILPLVAAQAMIDATIEVIPSAPTSADDIVVRVEFWLPDLSYGATFSELYRCDAYATFWDSASQVWVSFWASQAYCATLVITPPAPPPPGTIGISLPMEIGWSYHLGGLSPGRHYFVLSIQEAHAEHATAVAFTVEPSIEEILDENRNGRLEDDEILFAVELWIEEEKVPGTSINIIDDAAIPRLIELWITGAEIGRPSS